MTHNLNETTDTIWNAFGDSDSDSHTDSDFHIAADAFDRAITHRFAQLIKHSGIPLTERAVVVGALDGQVSDGRIVEENLSRRGIKVFVAMAEVPSAFACDAAVLLYGDSREEDAALASRIRRGVLPGGVLWIISPVGGHGDPLSQLSSAIWDTEMAIVDPPTRSFQLSRVQKRPCLVNAWSCPWMDKESVIPAHVSTVWDDSFGIPIVASETYLEYERRVASIITICPSLAERTREKVSIPNNEANEEEATIHATILTKEHVDRAVSILQQHGMVLIRGLLPPQQTIPWGNAILEDFQHAIHRLKNHPHRPVDILNPYNPAEHTARVFEPLSYKELAMREDLRVDLRSGPQMGKMTPGPMDDPARTAKEDTHLPCTVTGETAGTPSNWRFHPSILAILKALFNPTHDQLSGGNFGRWNFGGSGPDGSPQPFRIGPIGSVISCPGAGDQSLHADTPHLFECLDCLPCHYCNVFTPGYEIVETECCRNEFDGDGAWTGNSTMGGTALVEGSHRLSVTARLLSTGNFGPAVDPSSCRTLLELKTIRPAMDAGDVLIFDNRTLHYGLANTSRGDESGEDANAGRRPMLYLNVSQAWFHDPKNWDDREAIFS